MNIAILGAGGKMGCRLIDNLIKSPVSHRLLLVEISREGIERIAKKGLQTCSEDTAVREADVVILSLPDKVLGRVAHAVVPKLRSGCMVITLDPAVAHAGELPIRSDISYFVTHPCHPNVFDHFETEQERNDFFGGAYARQAIVCALMQGPEKDYAVGENLAREFFGTVTRSHRVTVEQMAILEPTMAETCGIALVYALRSVMEEAIRRGVPRAAAEDFMFGHLKVELGIAFGKAPFPLSDGAQLISKYGEEKILNPNWQSLFEPTSVLEQTKRIVGQEIPPR